MFVYVCVCVCVCVRARARATLFFRFFFHYRLLQDIGYTLFLVLCSRSLSIIYFIYSSVYMLIPNSQFIPLPPFPLVTVSFFSMRRDKILKINFIEKLELPWWL